MTRPQAMQTARDMWADGDGWTITEIRSYLASHGVTVTRETVRSWADPEWAELRRRAMRPVQRRYKRNKSGKLLFKVLDADARERLSSAGVSVAAPASAATPELLLALRLEDGLSYPAIAAVARRFLGVEMTEGQCRDRLNALGAPKNELKAASAKAHARARGARLSVRRAVIKERWDAGATVGEIAAELGTSKGVIAGDMYRMRAAGIRLAERRRGRRPRLVAA